VQDFPKAADYYKTGAQAGNVEAQWCLGRMCQLGQGLEQPDEAQALVWFTMAAEQNLAVAQYEVGRSLVPLFPFPCLFPFLVQLQHPSLCLLTSSHVGWGLAKSRQRQRGCSRDVSTSG
jgi:TPR repeat protein